MYGIFTYIEHKNQPNAGIYIPYMDPMGNIFIMGNIILLPLPFRIGD